MQRRDADVGADAAGARQLAQQRQQQRARAGPEIDDAQRARFASIAIEGGERRLHHGLGFRPGQEDLGIDFERQFPKFFFAADARDRFARQPPRRKLGDGGGLLGCEHAVRLRGEPGVIESQRVADEDARVERGCLEPVRAKTARERPPRGIDRGARKHVGRRCSAR